MRTVPNRNGIYTYQTGTNKLTHIEGTPPIDFGYDANGNITSETGWTYIYDLSNQLIRVLQNTNQIAEYTYNGAGQRIKKVTQTETRIFHYDLAGHLIAETNQTDQMLAEYIYLGDQLLSMIKPGDSVYYFHNDHLGTPQVLTNDSQTIAWKAVYTPFGDAVASIQTVENPFRFPGQYYDQETGLHYNYFRYYNPQTGRYITPDPIGLERGINLFAYVDSVGKPYLDVNLYTYTANNPVNLTDPQGLLIAPWHFVITYVAALNSGKGVLDSLKLARDVMREDRNTLYKSADAANIHAMAGRIEIAPGEYRPQTPDEALAATNYIIEKGPLSSALHATQDFPGHNLASMEDFDLNWSTVKHVFRDIFDIFWVFKAYQNTMNILSAKEPCK